MHKLCSIKDIVPGSVVELPKQYQSKPDEAAVILGMEYDTSKKNIFAEMLRSDYTKVAPEAMNEDTELALVDDPVLQKLAIRGFINQKFAMSGFGMSMGCDPEIFVVHADDSVFPAWEFMPDEKTALAESKRQPLLDRWINSDAVIPCPTFVPSYWDGAQAEFAPWGKSCLETLHYGTREGLKTVLAMARAKDANAKLTLRNVVELPLSVLKSTKDEYIQFRCSQSLNIYNDPGDGIPDAREYKYRCAGGHIHIGFTRAFTAPGIEQIIRGLDGILGVIGTSLAAGIDNPERRHTYGRAGEFRLPKHGVEYRVLSNHWLSHPAIAMLVFEIARSTVRFAESGLFNLCWKADEQETRDVINGCDVSGARKILMQNAAVLHGLLHRTWALRSGTTPRNAEDLDKMCSLAFKTILGGMDVAIKDPMDIEKNWKIGDDTNWKLHCRGKNDSWQSLACA
jgi:hypothetical protein